MQEQKVSSLHSLNSSLHSFNVLKHMMSKTTSDEFKTKLRFNPEKFSTEILKRYLINLLESVSIDELLNSDIPKPYTKDPNNITNYQVMKELGIISLKNWKQRLNENMNSIENLYLNDDMVLQDSKEYYECWRIIQNEIGGFEKQMGFFRLVFEIISELSSRSIVELSYDKNNDNVIINNNYEVPSKYLGEMQTKNKEIQPNIIEIKKQDAVEPKTEPKIESENVCCSQTQISGEKEKQAQKLENTQKNFVVESDVDDSMIQMHGFEELSTIFSESLNDTDDNLTAWMGENASILE